MFTAAAFPSATRGFSALALMLPSVFSQAGTVAAVGSITFAPADVSSVPALGGSALILLGILLAVIAIRFARQGAGNSASMVSVGTSGLALAAAASGVLLISDVEANGAAVQAINNPAGQTLEVFNTTNTFENAAGVPMSVVERDVASCDATADGCELGTVLEDGGSCDLVCIVD